MVVMDWHSRKVLLWSLSNTLNADFCVSALEEDNGLYGWPEIFNTAQGSQFASHAFTNTPKEDGIQHGRYYSWLTFLGSSVTIILDKTIQYLTQFFLVFSLAKSISIFHGTVR